MQPRIIVISGTYGVGKTTLAHHLANKLTIYQRIGLGSISKTIKYMSPENPVVKDWGNYNDYKTEDELIKKLHRESELVCNILRTVIYNAFCTGESYVIDGVQLLPEYLPLDKINYIALELLDYTEHFINQPRKYINNMIYL
ncbi:MAG: AAA family ATPase, partial [Patescibacteria group bacterium]|nr:AAA family ATPase [Patescibacteria group bacterium]